MSVEPNGGPSHRAFYVVVPFHNEAAGMLATLDALAAQSDTDFALVLVDNASTDHSAAVARAFARRHPHLTIELIHEPRKRNRHCIWHRVSVRHPPRRVLHRTHRR